jgi:hypothetical protein
VIRSGRCGRLLGVLIAGAFVWVSAELAASSASAQEPREVHDSPQAWTVQESYPPRIDNVADVSCPTRSDCWAVGTTASGAGAIVKSINGGGTWTSEAVTSGLHYLRSISCPTKTNCYAAGYDTSEKEGIPSFEAGVIVTTNGGTHPLRAVVPDGDQMLGGG